LPAIAVIIHWPVLQHVTNLASTAEVTGNKALENVTGDEVAGGGADAEVAVVGPLDGAVNSCT